MNRLKTNSRAASTQVSKEDARLTEMVNELLVSKPATIKKEPLVIDLKEYVRSGKASVSVPGINKLKAIQDFLNARRY